MLLPLPHSTCFWWKRRPRLHQPHHQCKWCKRCPTIPWGAIYGGHWWRAFKWIHLTNGFGNRWWQRWYAAVQSFGYQQRWLCDIKQYWSYKHCKELRLWNSTSYALTVSVQDGKTTVTTSLTITANNKNDAPVFKNAPYLKAVDENDAGAPVYIVSYTVYFFSFFSFFFLFEFQHLTTIRQADICTNGHFFPIPKGFRLRERGPAASTTYCARR